MCPKKEAKRCVDYFNRFRGNMTNDEYFKLWLLEEEAPSVRSMDKLNEFKAKCRELYTSIKSRLACQASKKKPWIGRRYDYAISDETSSAYNVNRSFNSETINTLSGGGV